LDGGQQKDVAHPTWLMPKLFLGIQFGWWATKRRFRGFSFSSKN
jgi:hypothetical protein